MDVKKPNEGNSDLRQHSVIAYTTAEITNLNDIKTNIKDFNEESVKTVFDEQKNELIKIWITDEAELIIFITDYINWKNYNFSKIYHFIGFENILDTVKEWDLKNKLSEKLKTDYKLNIKYLKDIVESGEIHWPSAVNIITNSLLDYTSSMVNNKERDFYLKDFYELVKKYIEINIKNVEIVGQEKSRYSDGISKNYIKINDSDIKKYLSANKIKFNLLKTEDFLEKDESKKSATNNKEEFIPTNVFQLSLIETKELLLKIKSEISNKDNIKEILTIVDNKINFIEKNNLKKEHKKMKWNGDNKLVEEKDNIGWQRSQ